MADKKKKKSSGLMTACVILAILIIIVFFLVKKDTIVHNLQATRFFDRVFGSTPEFVQNYEDSSAGQKVPLEEDSTVTIQIQSEKRPDSATESSSVIIPKSEKKSDESDGEEKGGAKRTEETQKTPANHTAEEIKKPQAEKNPPKTTETVTTQLTYTELLLCFVEVDGDGHVNRRIVKRSIPKNDSPLTTAINLLLEGPDATKNAERNCLSLIPSGTKLLGARVQDGIAYLNFNERFAMNPQGVEGYNAQLMQIVYTATNFSTVSSVQFLIEGEKKEYLSDGVWIRIDAPLSRGSF